MKKGGIGKEQDLGTLHMFPRKLFAVLCIVFFIGAVFSVGVVFVVGGPPSSGDWVVTGIESYSDQTIVLDGNLIVEKGGNLTFKKVTFELKCHYDGEYSISVNPGGKFYILDGSVITSHTPSNAYSFFVQSNSTFRMSNSELHSAGWVIPFVEEHVGLNILSDDAVVENCLISNNSHSIYVVSDGVVIRNNNITENYEGVRIGGEASIYNNYISKNGDGIHICGAGSPSVYDNTIEYNLGSGIGIADGTPIIRNNNIVKNRGGGIHYYSRANPMILNNTIASNNYWGITVRDHSTGTIQENKIEKNPCGISVSENSNPTIRANYIASNGWTGINPNSGSNPKIESNIIMKNGMGIFCDFNASGTISGNTITENIDGGISCHNYSNPTIANNIITSNLGWAGGIHCSYHSDPTILNNTIAAHEIYGIVCENSNPTIQGNNITANGNGIALERSNAIVRENVITSNNGTGMWSGLCSPIIQGNNISSNKEYGIVFKPNCTGIIQGNIIESNLGDGIHLGDGCDTLIKENIITSNNRTGIVIGGYSRPTVEGNRIEVNGVGILVDSNSTPTIQANQINANDEDGVSFMNWGSGSLQGNRIMGNGVGVSLRHYCSPTIQGNIIDHNTGDCGIRCEDKSNPEIHNNDIYSNTGFGIANLDLSITINAIQNCWGSPTGPVQSPPDAGDPEEISGNIFYNPWLTEPILIAEITNPLSNETVSAMVTVSANVRARSGVQKVEFHMEELTYTDFDSPYEWNWDTTQYAETPHTIWVVVHDIYGLITKVSRTVLVDNTPPTALFKEPQSGITYYGMVTISVNATDNRELGNVRVKVDNGAWLVMTYNPTNSLWEYTFNTTTLSDAQHTIMSLALDKAGNPATTSITILTDNTPPALTIQHPQSGITVGLTLTVMVQANDISSVSKVEFYLHNPLPTLVSTITTVPYQWAWDTTKYPNGAYTITVKAYDTIGNVKTRDITVTVNNVEVPWLQANLLTIVQVAIGLGGLALAIVTYWSRTKDKRKKKKTTKKKETKSVSPQEDSGKQD